MSLFEKLVSKTIMHVPGPIVEHFANGYIAGENLAAAVDTTARLNSKGMEATIDILGEFIKTKDEAIFYKEQCIEIFKEIKNHNLNANVSLKPTQMGLQLDTEFAFANILEIVKTAKESNNFVRIDMEDTPCTNATLVLFERLRRDYEGHVGTVLLAYLRRTSDDIDNLSQGYQNYRLCKGIYNEPRSLAWKDYQTVNLSYVHCLEKLFNSKAYVGIATHDERLVFEAMKLIRQYGLQRNQYEFQMLLGVDEELREVILKAGHRLRVYVPYGRDWLPYSRRRLKENPMIARHALKQMFGL
jgi:proline dehydrogenase